MKRRLSALVFGLGMIVSLGSTASAQVCNTCPDCGGRRGYYNNYQQNIANQQMYQMYRNAAIQAQARNSYQRGYYPQQYRYNYNRGGNSYYRNSYTGNNVSSSGKDFYIMGDGLTYSNF